MSALFSSPVGVDAVGPLVKRQRFDLVLADLTRLGLQPRRHVSLQGAVLPLDGPHLQQFIMEEFVHIDQKKLFTTVMNIFYLLSVKKTPNIPYMNIKMNTTISENNGSF